MNANEKKLYNGLVTLIKLNAEYYNLGLTDGKYAGSDKRLKNALAEIEKFWGKDEAEKLKQLYNIKGL